MKKLAIYEGERGVYRIDVEDSLFGYQELYANDDDWKEWLNEIPEDVLAEYQEIIPRYEKLMKTLEKIKHG